MTVFFFFGIKSDEKVHLVHLCEYQRRAQHHQQHTPVRTRRTRSTPLTCLSPPCSALRHPWRPRSFIITVTATPLITKRWRAARRRYFLEASAVPSFVALLVVDSAVDCTSAAAVRAAPPRLLPEPSSTEMKRWYVPSRASRRCLVLLCPPKPSCAKCATTGGGFRAFWGYVWC